MSMSTLTRQRKQALSVHAPQQPRKLTRATQPPSAIKVNVTWSDVWLGAEGSCSKLSRINIARSKCIHTLSASRASPLSCDVTYTQSISSYAIT